MKDVEDAIAMWREAAAQARAAEALLARARQEYESRCAPAVSAVLIEQVAQARERADKKLSVALEVIRLKSGALNPEAQTQGCGAAASPCARSTT